MRFDSDEEWNEEEWMEWDGEWEWDPNADRMFTNAITYKVITYNAVSSGRDEVIGPAEAVGMLFSLRC